MKSISAVIITLNEETNIEDCLQSVDFVDEIIVIDSGSCDRTVELARKYTPHVFSIQWTGFAAAKNFGIDRASHDWILSIDADERVSGELKDAILAVKSLPADVSGYSIPRRTWYLNRWIRGGGWYPDRNIRLFNRKNGRFDDVCVHESVNLAGPVEPLSGDILHFSYRDISDHVNRINRYSSLSAQIWHEHGRRTHPLVMIFRPVWECFRSYILRGGFRDGREGIILAMLHGYYVFLKYAKLRELRLHRNLP
ncbi:MAG TPA: glycosyltransferase family 2 protein [bacterium]|nr:glycosyltransferase family 2 protein [bacterium]